MASGRVERSPDSSLVLLHFLKHGPSRWLFIRMPGCQVIVLLYLICFWRRTAFQEHKWFLSLIEAVTKNGRQMTHPEEHVIGEIKKARPF